ncbi:MAG: mandelate racemase/muconate lactonizing enzyme family protein [Nitrospiraceae bacterium]|nr:mandelate racemase/muconate lactonizing enzyme family protein [Nitrospiraceae bacterium]
MAKISRIEVLAVGPDVPRTTWASMEPQIMSLNLVRVTDADGAEGIGASENYSGNGFDLSSFEGMRTVAPLLLGKEALDREARWREMQNLVQPLPPGTIGPIDVALWDLAGKRAGLPLYRLLGGYRDSIPSYASTPQLDDDGAYLKHVEDLMSLGYRAIKFHAWNVPERDLSMLRAVHREFGSAGLELMHDAENRYGRHDGVRVARELESMGFRWFEAPYIDYDIQGYVELRRRVAIPIVPHGLWLWNLYQFRSALELGAWDALRFDVTEMGGITQARKVMALAEAFGLTCEPQSWGYSMIQFPNLHMGLAFSSASFFESPVPYEPYEFGVANPIRPDALGRVWAPEGSGLGMEVDWDQIRSATIASAAFDA